MAETLSFPGLGLEFEINRVAFTVGGGPIYWYGIIVAAAFLAAAAYTLSRTKVFGLDGDRVMDVVLGGVLFGIIGARLYYVVFRWNTYSQNPLSVFNIREGGIAIYGGIIGGVLAAVLLCRLRQVKLLPMLDLASGGILLGQAIGRWGNFVNMEAFGTGTTAKWGMTSPSIEWYLRQNAVELMQLGVKVDPKMPVHPTFFYESAWCLLGFILIVWFTKRRRFDGEIGLIYLGWYGLGRFFIEGLRTDSLMLGTMRVSQVVALICVLSSVVVFVNVMSKIKRSNDPEYMPLYVNTDEGRAVLAGGFYKKKGAACLTDEKSDDVPPCEGDAEKNVETPPEYGHDVDVVSGSEIGEILEDAAENANTEEAAETALEDKTDDVGGTKEETIVKEPQDGENN